MDVSKKRSWLLTCFSYEQVTDILDPGCFLFDRLLNIIITLTQKIEYETIEFPKKITPQTIFIIRWVISINKANNLKQEILRWFWPKNPKQNFPDEKRLRYAILNLDDRFMKKIELYHALVHHEI